MCKYDIIRYHKDQIDPIRDLPKALLAKRDGILDDLTAIFPIADHFSSVEGLVKAAMDLVHWRLGKVAQNLTFDGNYHDHAMPGFLFLVIDKLRRSHTYAYKQEDAISDAKLFLSKGASVELRDATGRTVLDRLSVSHPELTLLRDVLMTQRRSAVRRRRQGMA